MKTPPAPPPSSSETPPETGPAEQLDPGDLHLMQITALVVTNAELRVRVLMFEIQDAQRSAAEARTRFESLTREKYKLAPNDRIHPGTGQIERAKVSA